jgi:membrane associated rhomboid family serine protease
MDDTPARRRTPVAALLVAATVAAFAAQRLLPLGDLEALARLGGLRPERLASDHEYFRLVMPIFLHHDLLHLGLNLFALVQLGWLCEEFFGSRRLLVTYVWCGVAGLLASAFLSAVPYVVSIGASGAVLGLAGLLLGTMWYGSDPTRSELVDLLGRRLLWSVLLTFGFGVGLWFVSDVVDNWAHAGGFLCGVAFSFVWDEGELEVDEDGEIVEEAPPDDPLWRTLAAAGTAAVLAGAVVWTWVAGGDWLPTLSIDTARTYAARASLQPGAWQNATLLYELLVRYEESGAPEAAHEPFARGVAAFEDRWPLATLANDLDRDARAGRPRDRERLLVAERLVVVAPTDPEVLNLLAWYLLVVHDPSLRDPVRAEGLARRALSSLEDRDSETGRRSTAAFLDTHAEALFQLGRAEEALAAQEQATQLARELEVEEIAEFETRLAKIRRSLERG